MKRTSKIARLFKSMWMRESRWRESKIWDEKLQDIIKNTKMTSTDGYTVTFDDKWMIWISNHPYKSGNLYKIKNENGIWNIPKYEFNCSIKTAIKLEDLIYSQENNIFSEYLNSI